jgi:dynein light chain LC8-type
MSKHHHSFPSQINQSIFAIGKFKKEEEISKFIKQFFDFKYGQNWNCVVGKNFGHYGPHESGTYIFFYIGQIAVLLYRI